MGAVRSHIWRAECPPWDLQPLSVGVSECHSMGSRNRGGRGHGKEQSETLCATGPYRPHPLVMGPQRAAGDHSTQEAQLLENSQVPLCPSLRSPGHPASHSGPASPPLPALPSSVLGMGAQGLLPATTDLYPSPPGASVRVRVPKRWRSSWWRERGPPGSGKLGVLLLLGTVR
jgi:hypothetical protein